MISRRGWISVLGGLGAFLIGLLSFNILLLLLGVVFLTFVLAELLLFAVETRDLAPSHFAVRREESPRHVPVGALGGGRITVTFHGRGQFWAELYDWIPDTIEVIQGSPRLVAHWGPGDTRSVVYYYRPVVRGRYKMGPLQLVVHDALGFGFRTMVLGTVDLLNVPPQVPAVPLGRFGVRLRSQTMGSTPVSYRGFGTEFRSLRPYVPSDDVRAIAWKRSRPDRILVREFEQESRQEFLCLLDASSTMGAGERGRTALDRSVEAAATLAGITSRRDDTFGLLVFADRAITYIPPGRGARQLQLVTEALTVAKPTTEAFVPTSALEFLRENLLHPTHVFAFSALGGPLERFHDVHGAFSARGHRLYVFLPSLAAFYPALPEAADQMALRMTQAEENLREDAVHAYVNREGVPVFRYDREGAMGKMAALYMRIHTWGAVR